MRGNITLTLSLSKGEGRFAVGEQNDPMDYFER